MTVTSTRPPASVAPWAEAVPGYGPVTVDLLSTLPDDGYRYEVVAGVLVRMAGSGDEATTIAFNFGLALGNFVAPRRLGRLTGADGVYKFPGAETGLLPDVGFYAAEKRALIVDRSKPIPFAPDLAVEVATPSQDTSDMAAKARTYTRIFRGERCLYGSSGHGASRLTCGAPDSSRPRRQRCTAGTRWTGRASYRPSPTPSPLYSPIPSPSAAHAMAAKVRDRRGRRLSLRVDSLIFARIVVVGLYV